MPARTTARSAASLLAALAIVVSGCVTTLPVPTPAPAVTPAGDPTPRPKPTAHPYVVRSGDSLSRIARRFDLTVGQLLTANPQLTDPNLLQVGQTLVIPPPGAPDTSPTSGGLPDGRDDLVDPNEDPTTGEGYADIDGLGIRVTRGDVRIEMGLTARAPARIDPGFESLMYTVVLDIDDDDQPDYRIKYGNDGDATGALTASLEDRATGVILSGKDFPGSVEVRQGAIVWTIDNAAIGSGARYRIAGKVERSFYPGGRSDPEVESTIDYAPNQQWPYPNPRWVELGAPPASPAA